MDNNDTLREIAERNYNGFIDNYDDLRHTVRGQDIFFTIENAVKEAYNLGIPVSVKEYAVEVLEGLKLELTKSQVQIIDGCPILVECNREALSLIESTITELPQRQTLATPSRLTPIP